MKSKAKVSNVSFKFISGNKTWEDAVAMETLAVGGKIDAVTIALVVISEFWTSSLHLSQTLLAVWRKRVWSTSLSAWSA